MSDDRIWPPSVRWYYDSRIAEALAAANVNLRLADAQDRQDLNCVYLDDSDTCVDASTLKLTLGLQPVTVQKTSSFFEQINGGGVAQRSDLGVRSESEYCAGELISQTDFGNRTPLPGTLPGTLSSEHDQSSDQSPIQTPSVQPTTGSSSYASAAHSEGAVVGISAANGLVISPSQSDQTGYVGAEEGVATASNFELSQQVVDPIYVLIFDNFGYQSAIQESVHFFDYQFEFEDGWEDYFLDSLAPDELAQLPYEYGFGLSRVPDDNGDAIYDSYYDYTGTLVDSQDAEVGDYVDDDPDWDYFVPYGWDEETGLNKDYFINDIDGLDSVPWLQEGLDLGMYLIHYDYFTDLDGATNFYDESDIDPYDKTDADPVNDFVFFNWEADTLPNTETGQLVYRTKPEIETAYLEGVGGFTESRTHGDIVLDSFYSQLDADLADRVVVIAIDGWDDHYLEQDSVWIDGLIANGNIDLDEVLSDP